MNQRTFSSCAIALILICLLLLPLQSVTTADNAPADARLSGTWYVVSINGERHTPLWLPERRQFAYSELEFAVPGTTLTTTLTTPLTVTAYLGCNFIIFWCTITQSHTLQSCSRATTLMYCEPDELMHREDQLYQLISGTLTYTLSATNSISTLVITGPTGVVTLSNQFPLPTYLPLIRTERQQ